MDEWSFCALIEHELCHIAQDVNAFGEPKFDRNGQPVLRLVGHDVEEFVDVVARYGAGEVLGSTPTIRSRYVRRDDLDPGDFGEPCPKCGGAGVVGYDLEGEIDD